jgi:para-nitrobenzyl esterase
MLRSMPLISVAIILSSGIVSSSSPPFSNQVRTSGGIVEGFSNSDHSVRTFRGIPFAAPPVGEMRWKPPQPAKPWNGVRKADQFAAHCMQTDVFHDIFPRDAGQSEDCLYLNVWTPAKSSTDNLAVTLWFYGGGFVAGAASEPRYDGENLAKKGVIIVSPNYRLTVFGFFSHPELTKESEQHASGNYGLLDQVAALKWVVNNISAFGGDPHNITIAGESAGSFSVSALMASPLSKGLFQKAIGESGAFFPDPPHSSLPLMPASETEKTGMQFASQCGAKSLADLRMRSADNVLREAQKTGVFKFGPNIDGYFLKSDPAEIYSAGHQSHVPLLAGWNADEGKMRVLMAPQKPTAESFAIENKERFGDRYEQFTRLFPGTTDQQALRSAEELASADFITYSTWKWLNLQLQTGEAPVYGYQFEAVPAVKPSAMLGTVPASEAGAKHAGEIEYVFDTLNSQDVPWTPADFTLSNTIATYWTNFAKTGNPNGPGLPKWLQYKPSNRYQIMHLSPTGPGSMPETYRERYELLDAEARASLKQQRRAGSE